MFERRKPPFAAPKARFALRLPFLIASFVDYRVVHSLRTNSAALYFMHDTKLDRRDSQASLLVLPFCCCTVLRCAWLEAVTWDAPSQSAGLVHTDHLRSLLFPARSSYPAFHNVPRTFRNSSHQYSISVLGSFNPRFSGLDFFSKARLRIRVCEIRHSHACMLNQLDFSPRVSHVF